MKKNMNAAAAVIALGVSVLASVAGAGTITAKYTSNLGQSANITASGGIYDGSVNTVAFHWTRTDTAGAGVDSTVPITFDTYCVDLEQNVRANTNFTFQVISMADAGYSALQRTLLTQLWAASKASIDTKEESAAFQLAVWEIVYDTNLNTSNGSFKVNSSSTLRNAAQVLVTNASNLASNPAAANFDLVVLRSDNAQDQITAVPVPSPGAAALAGFGALLAFPRRKKAAK